MILFEKCKIHKNIFRELTIIHYTYEITIIGGTHVPTTTLRNGGGKSRDTARRSIIFMAVH